MRQDLAAKSFVQRNERRGEVWGGGGVGAKENKPEQKQESDNLLTDVMYYINSQW